MDDGAHRPPRGVAIPVPLNLSAIVERFRPLQAFTCGLWDIQCGEAYQVKSSSAGSIAFGGRAFTGLAGPLVRESQLLLRHASQGQQPGRASIG